MLVEPSVPFCAFTTSFFRRISYGATRLQEVLADRIAASKYGAAGI